jgi:hypothetical protein
MRADLPKICAVEFEKRVAEMFRERENQALANGKLLARAPIIGWFFDLFNERQIRAYEILAANALGAQKHYEETAPPWACPLIVREKELEYLPRDDRSARSLLRYEFASSMRHHEWDFVNHPTFTPFARSALAHEHPPDEFRSDPSLRKEFPPEAVVELYEEGCHGGVTVLHWRSPEMIAHYEASLAFHETRRNGGSLEKARQAARRICPAWT